MGGKDFLVRNLQEFFLFNPKKLIIFSRDEIFLGNVKNFTSDKIRFNIGDIRDKERLSIFFMDVDCIIHFRSIKNSSNS